MVLWDGEAIPTSFVGPTVLVAEIAAGDIVAPGTVLVTARNPGLGDGDATPPLTFAVKANQTISFGPLPNHRVGDAPFTVDATATSGLAVSFSVSGVCTVVGSTVTLTGEGNCTITANEAGDATHYPAMPVNQMFAIGPINVYVPGALNGKGID
jgi:hypothetical protein